MTGFLLLFIKEVDGIIWTIPNAKNDFERFV